MMHPYVAAALLTAEYEIDSDGQAYGWLGQFPEVNASGPTFQVCRQRLRTAVEAWIAAAEEQNQALSPLFDILPPGQLLTTMQVHVAHQENSGQ